MGEVDGGGRWGRAVGFEDGVGLRVGDSVGREGGVVAGA